MLVDFVETETADNILFHKKRQLTSKTISTLMPDVICQVNCTTWNRIIILKLWCLMSNIMCTNTAGKQTLLYSTCSSHFVICSKYYSLTAVMRLQLRCWVDRHFAERAVQKTSSFRLLCLCVHLCFRFGFELRVWFWGWVELRRPLVPSSSWGSLWGCSCRDARH